MELEKGKLEIERDAKLIEKITIKAPNFQTATFRIVGLSEYVQHKFPAKAKARMLKAMMEGKTMKSNKKDKRNFEAECLEATYISREGFNGIPASCFRAAAISACRLVGFKMTLAKLAFFTEADGYDIDDGSPLVRIYGESRMRVDAVRNSNGSCDLRARPAWAEWHADIRIRWDGDIFNAGDILNLLVRVGLQVGIGEGRPDSKSSAGMGWGLFTVETLADV